MVTESNPNFSLLFVSETFIHMVHVGCIYHEVWRTEWDTFRKQELVELIELIWFREKSRLHLLKMTQMMIFFFFGHSNAAANNVQQEVDSYLNDDNHTLEDVEVSSCETNVSRI